MDNDLFEHELDHVFFGKSNEKPVPNKDEVADYKYLSIKSIQQDLIHNSNRALLVRGVAGTVLRKLDAVLLPSFGKDLCHRIYIIRAAKKRGSVFFEKVFCIPFWYGCKYRLACCHVFIGLSWYNRGAVAGIEPMHRKEEKICIPN